jgi:hypothetical protein
MIKTKTGIPMTKNNRLNILRRAREIISDPRRWASKTLRDYDGTQERFCVIGACEQAAYDLGLAQAGPDAFLGREDGTALNGYDLGEDLALTEYSRRQYGDVPWAVNDRRGHESTIELLDRFIAEVT